MKKSLVTLLLVFATVAVAQQAPAGSTQQPAAGQEAAAPAGQPQQQKKEIKDPAEYNAYVNAVQQQDAGQRAVSLESFLQSYPNSVMKPDAMELLVKSYQQAGNAQKSIEAAQRLLQADPNNLTALALLAYVNSTQAQGPNALQMIQQGAEYGEKGLAQLKVATKPEGMSDADWQKLKQTYAQLFNSAIGTNALQAKDYAKAQKTLLAAVTEAPAGQPQSFLDVYRLALANLEPKPIVVDGLFWIARAAALAQQQVPQMVPQIQQYAKSKYVRYHGSDEGFNELLQSAAQTPTIPQGFTIAPAPSPAEQAAEMMKKGTPPAQMSFGEWEFILTSGNQQAAEQVWTAIKGKLIKMQGWYLAGSGKTIQLAGTPDAKDANTPDIELTLDTPLTAAKAPKPGQLVTFQGVLESYAPQPFLVKMSDGALAGQTAGAAPKAGTGTKAPVKKTPH